MLGLKDLKKNSKKKTYNKIWWDKDSDLKKWIKWEKVLVFITLVIYVPYF